MVMSKRILILNYEFPPLGGGAGNATYYLLKEYAKDSTLQVDLVTSSVDSFRTETFADNITIHYLDIGKKGNLHYQSNKDLLTYSFKAYRYAKKLMREGAQYDLCHAFFGIPCGYIAMQLGLPYIVSLRGSDVPFHNKRYYWLDRLIFQRLSRKVWHEATAVVANSQKLRELALRTSPDQDIQIIFNGVDINEFQARSERGNGSTLKIIATGRLSKQKGHKYLIEAISDMKDVGLCLVGDGDQKESLKLLAKRCGSNVHFVGKVDHEDIKSLLQGSDIFVLPSLNEGMSNSLLEAMACGLPVITTDTGGSKELVRENGIVVPSKDVQKLREAIMQLKMDHVRREAMSKQSRTLAVEMGWEKTAQKYYELYTSNI